MHIHTRTHLPESLSPSEEEDEEEEEDLRLADLSDFVDLSLSDPLSSELYTSEAWKVEDDIKKLRLNV